VAAEKLNERLHQRFPGFRWTPTPRFLVEHRLIDNGRDEKQVLSDAAQILADSEKVKVPEMVRHTLTIEVRDAQLSDLLEEDRHERGIERLWLAGRGLGGLLVMLVAIVGYLRLDDWTKGYLSFPLKIGALAVAVAGPVVLWWLV
jgi:hypothetical protein